MSDPRWIEFARSKIGVWTDGPDVPRLASEVADKFPEFATYAQDATSTTPWCGIFVARCFAEVGIKPVSTADGLGFMWAQRWKHFGDEVTRPEVGDVLVFPHHVTFYVGQDADHYECLGGNQHDGVNVTSFAKSNCEAILRAPAATAKPAEKIQNSTEVATSDWQSGKGSWYSQFTGKYEWRDTGDEPGSAALGVPDELQGVSFYNHPTLGKWFEVEAPNGVRSIEQQTDIGPNPRTGRKIDISAAAAERFGYTPRNFPTDGLFHWREIEAPASVASLPPKRQAALYAAARGSQTPIPTPLTPEAPVAETPAVVTIAPNDDTIKKVATELKRQMESDPAVKRSIGTLAQVAISAVSAAFPQFAIFGSLAQFLLANAGFMGTAIGESTTPTGQAAGATFLAMAGSWVVSKLNGLFQKAPAK